MSVTGTSLNPSSVIPHDKAHGVRADLGRVVVPQDHMGLFRALCEARLVVGQRRPAFWSGHDTGRACRVNVGEPDDIGPWSAKDRGSAVRGA